MSVHEKAQCGERRTSGHVNRPFTKSLPWRAVAKFDYVAHSIWLAGECP